MIARGQAEFFHEARRYRLAVLFGPKSVSLDCAAQDGKPDVCVRFLALAWAGTPRRLIASVSARAPFQMEDAGGLSYEDEGDGLRAQVEAFDQNESVAPERLERLLVAFGLAALEAARAAGRDDWLSVTPNLLALRDRAR